MIFKAEVWREERQNNLDIPVQNKDNTCLTSCPVWKGEKKATLDRGYNVPRRKISIRAGRKDHIKKLKIWGNLVVAW